MELGSQLKTDFIRAYSHHFVLVTLGATKLANDFSQDVVLRWAKDGQVVCYEVVNGEDIGHLDVQGWFGACEEIVILINVELAFRIADVDHCDLLVFVL